MKRDSVLQCFSQITDLRRHISRIHDLITILLIGVVATLCGAETWKEMEDLQSLKKKF